MNCQAAGCESKQRAQIHALSFYDIKCPSFVGQKYMLLKNKATSLRKEVCQCVYLRIRKAVLALGGLSEGVTFELSSKGQKKKKNPDI